MGEKVNDFGLYRLFADYGRIAVLLLALLAGTILGIFLLLWLGTIDVPGAKEFLAVLVSPLVGLVGAATGFYYGGKD